MDLDVIRKEYRKEFEDYANTRTINVNMKAVQEMLEDINEDVDKLTKELEKTDKAFDKQAENVNMSMDDYRKYLQLAHYNGMVNMIREFLNINNK